MRYLLVLAALLQVGLAHGFDPSAPGVFFVGDRTVTFVDASRGGRTLVTELWYPALAPARDAEPRTDLSPLVLLLHGHCGSRLNYTYLARHIASRGCTVAAPDLPDFCADTGAVDITQPPLDVTFLRKALRDKTGPTKAFVPSLRGKKAAVVGHSLGGYMAVNAALADSKLPVLVLLAPFAVPKAASDLAALKHRPAVLVEAGLADTRATFTGVVRPFYDLLVRPSFLVSITGGTHSGFTDTDDSLTPEQLARQQDLAKRFAAAAIERYLAHDLRAARALTSHDAGLQGDDVALEVHAAKH